MPWVAKRHCKEEIGERGGGSSISSLSIISSLKNTQMKLHINQKEVPNVQ